jgi:two-component system, sensor histidine kinase and response regulator
MGAGQHRDSHTTKSPVFDLAAALDRVEGDRELLQELVNLFLEEYPQLVKEIREGLRCQDAKLVQRPAHSLKSALGNLSAVRSFEAAYRLELLSRDAQLSELETAFILLEDELSTLRSAMQPFLDTSVQ